MLDSLFSVEKQVVFVSGASRGIGLAIAKGFAKRNAKVIITGRFRETLEVTAKEISGTDSSVDWVVCDVTDRCAIHDAVEHVVSRHGGIDTLVNVAGINLRKPAVEFKPTEYDEIMDVNLKGAFLMSQTVGDRMGSVGSTRQLAGPRFCTNRFDEEGLGNRSNGVLTQR